VEGVSVRLSVAAAAGRADAGGATGLLMAGVDALGAAFRAGLADTVPDALSGTVAGAGLGASILLRVADGAAGASGVVAVRVCGLEGLSVCVRTVASRPLIVLVFTPLTTASRLEPVLCAKPVRALSIGMPPARSTRGVSGL